MNRRRAPGGSWMVSIPGHPGPQQQHWVQASADTEPYMYGKAPYSVCRTPCIPADTRYRQGIPRCDQCARNPASAEDGDQT